MLSIISPVESNSLTLKNVAIALTLIAVAFTGCKPKSTPTDFNNGIKKVNHIVVIYMENHSFDNLYGQFEGANGIANAGRATRQINAQGHLYPHLPFNAASCTYPTDLPDSPFNIDKYIPSFIETQDVVHRYYQEQMQIDSGKMDKFVQFDNISEGLTMGYYKTSALPLDTFAKQYTLCDNFFHSAFGGSFLNHQWLIAARSPVFPNAPKSLVATTDSTGKMIHDGSITPDGFVVNTSFSKTLFPKGLVDSVLVPNQPDSIKTIGDLLSEQNVSWAWYSGGWDNALAKNADASFQYHHQPFVYYPRYAIGTDGQKKHLLDENCFFAAAKNGTLPQVSFVKPLGIDNEHPGYSEVRNGENHAVELINAVLNGPDGKDAVIIVTYDENGGFWDHVAPPLIDKKWGPGSRIPAIIISPFAKKGFVDHTEYETVSILNFIEKRWGLPSLTWRDKRAAPLQNAFNF